jgi:ABC-type lipoprotein export system ATPase subunit
MLAIMGPSGSGKTSLLNVLAQKIKANKQIKLCGSISYEVKDDDELASDEFESENNNAENSQRIAYVKQEDLFFEQLSVYEQIEMMYQLAQYTSNDDENQHIGNSDYSLNHGHIRKQQMKREIQQQLKHKVQRIIAHYKYRLGWKKLKNITFTKQLSQEGKS